MPQRRASMIDPPIESLLSRVDSKFSLVTVAAKRARQINQYFNELGAQSLGNLVPPQVSSVSRKPLSIALEEIVADKIEIHRKAPAVAVLDELASAGGVVAEAVDTPAPEVP